MDHELQAGKNFAWMTIAQVVLRVLGMALFILMTYKIGEVGIGQYSFITSFVLFWFLISDFGSGTYLYREWSRGGVSEEKVARDFNISLTLRVIVNSLVFLVFVIFNYFSDNREILFPLTLFFITTFISVIVGLGDYYFQSINSFRKVANRQMIEKIVTVVLGALLLLIVPRLEMVFIAMFLGQAVCLVYYLFSIPFKFQLIFDKKRMKELVAFGIPFLLVVFFTSIYSRIDMVMLKYFGDFEAVGFYSTAYRFLDLGSIFVAGLLMPAIFPVLSSLYRESLEKFSAFFYKSLRIIFSYSLLVIVFFLFFSPFIISFFFADSFGPSILALRILILVLVFGSISVLFNNLLFIQGKEKKGLAIIVFSAGLNIVLNIFLIPRYSLYGAAAATVVAEIVNLFLLQYFSAWKKDWGLIIRMLVVTVFNGLAFFLLKLFGQLGNPIIGGLFFLLEVLLLYRTKLLRIDDLALFLNPLKNKFNNIFKTEEII